MADNADERITEHPRRIDQRITEHQPTTRKRRSDEVEVATLLLAILGVPVGLLYGWAALFWATLIEVSTGSWHALCPEYLTLVAAPLSDSLAGFAFALLGFAAWKALRRGRQGRALVVLAWTALGHAVLWVCLLIIAGTDSFGSAGWWQWWLLLAAPVAVSAPYALWILATWRHRHETVAS